MTEKCRCLPLKCRPVYSTCTCFASPMLRPYHADAEPGATTCHSHFLDISSPQRDRPQLPVGGHNRGDAAGDVAHPGHQHADGRARHRAAPAGGRAEAQGQQGATAFCASNSPNEDCARLFCCGPVHVSVMPSSCRGGLQAQSAFDPKSICRRQRQEYTFRMQAAAERTSALRRTIDQAHHRATELKDHIKVWSHQTPDTRPAAHCVEMRTRASSLVSRFNAHSLQILWTAP